MQVCCPEGFAWGAGQKREVTVPIAAAEEGAGFGSVAL